MDNGVSKEVDKKLPVARDGFQDFTAEEISKYQKYEADYACRLRAKYFSNKDFYGADIFDLTVEVGDQTIKAGRWSPTLSYADPTQSSEDPRSVATSQLEMPPNISNVITSTMDLTYHKRKKKKGLEFDTNEGLKFDNNKDANGGLEIGINEDPIQKMFRDFQEKQIQLAQSLSEDELKIISTIKDNIYSILNMQFSNSKSVLKKTYLKRMLGSGFERSKTLNYEDAAMPLNPPDEKDIKYYNQPLTTWKIKFHQKYCGENELDTKVVHSFCELLQTNFGEHGVKVVSPLNWAANFDNVGLDLHFKHPIYEEHTKEIHIGVLDQHHFFSVHVLFKESAIYIMDSSFSSLSSTHQIHVYLLIQHLHGCHKVDKDIWNIISVSNNPQQFNSYDCGVYMVKALEFWIKRLRLPFSTDNAMQARYIILHQIENNSISLMSSNEVIEEGNLHEYASSDAPILKSKT